MCIYIVILSFILLRCYLRVLHSVYTIIFLIQYYSVPTILLVSTLDGKLTALSVDTGTQLVSINDKFIYR